MRKITITVFASLLLGATTVLAQQSPGSGGMMGGPGGMGGSGGMMDGSGPSGMNQQGMMGQYGYSRIDRDGDGYISQEEVQQHQQLLERMQSNWEQADQNGDGQVDVGEFSAFEQAYQNEQGQ